MKRQRGWIYREPACGITPARLRVELGEVGERQHKTFDDNNRGATELADHVSKELGRDDWKLEDMHFLGYRIVTGE